MRFAFLFCLLAGCASAPEEKPLPSPIYLDQVTLDVDCAAYPDGLYRVELAVSSPTFADNFEVTLLCE